MFVGKVKTPDTRPVRCAHVSTDGAHIPSTVSAKRGGPITTRKKHDCCARRQLAVVAAVKREREARGSPGRGCTHDDCCGAAPPASHDSCPRAAKNQGPMNRDRLEPRHPSGVQRPPRAHCSADGPRGGLRAASEDCFFRRMTSREQLVNVMNEPFASGSKPHDSVAKGNGGQRDGTRQA